MGSAVDHRWTKEQKCQSIPQNSGTSASPILSSRGTKSLTNETVKLLGPSVPQVYNWHWRLLLLFLLLHQYPDFHFPFNFGGRAPLAHISSVCVDSYKRVRPTDYLLCSLRVSLYCCWLLFYCFIVLPSTLVGLWNNVLLYCNHHVKKDVDQSCPPPPPPPCEEPDGAKQDDWCYLCMFNTVSEGALTGRPGLQVYGENNTPLSKLSITHQALGAESALEFTNWGRQEIDHKMQN